MPSRKQTQKHIPEWIQVEIDRVRANNAPELDLSLHLNQDHEDNSHREILNYIPEDIFDLLHLKELVIKHQDIYIKEIPSRIGKLRSLRKLTIDGDFESIPASIDQLVGLKYLSFGSNWEYIHERPGRLRDSGRLIHIPDSLFKLVGLNALKLVGRFESVSDRIRQLYNLKELSLIAPLNYVPNGIESLENLESLVLMGNYADVPHWIGNLKNLGTLELWGQYRTLPDSFRNLKHLKQLTLIGHIASIPDFVFELSDLDYLNISHNPISIIPEDIITLDKLTGLSYWGCDIQHPPPEIVGDGWTGNLKAIRNYFRGIAEEEQDHLYEAKLLILGEGGAGKTTLRRKIQNPQCSLLDEKSTEGIDVQRWDFQIQDKRDFRVNLWDFGGQEIYHATHQFFLTNRSLYALVADDRKEDTDFYYWLNIIELLGGDSPILIIKNEKQDRARQIGEPQLRARFKNIVGIVATNFNTNRGLDALLDEIKLRMRQLPHVGTPLPRSWVQVRQALEADSRNYIRLEEYYDLCAGHGMIDRSMQDTVITYLHDLGVCLHFHVDPVLKHFVILKPQWGTSAVYTVLDNKQVIRNRGLFTRADLETIWTDPTYDGMHDELLHLMMRFKLCFEIPGKSQHYMAPQLLSENQPTYEWDGLDNRYLRFKYEFMPKGLVTRLIVALNRSIDGKKMWKTGVILKKGETSAEVIEHYQDRQIHIRLRGSDKRGLLAVIMHEMEEIHQSYPGLKYDALVPCNCPDCSQTSEPYFFAYETLQRAVGTTPTVQCQSTFNNVSPRQLLDDSLPDQFDFERAGIATSVNVTGNIESMTVLAGGSYMEQGRSKFDNRISGNVQAGNLNQGEQSFGDNASITLNVNTLPHAVAGTPMAELKALIEQLQNALQQLSPEQAEDAQLVQECADEAIEEATKEEPNRRRLEIKGKSLIEAAKNLAAVTPIAVEIAKKLLLLA